MKRFRFRDKPASAHSLDGTGGTTPNARLEAAIDARLGKETRTADKNLNPNARMQAAIDARLGKK